MMPRLTSRWEAAAIVIAAMLAAPALASVAGPPVPVTPRQTPAEQAIAFAHRNDAPPPKAIPVTCRKTNGELTTACGVKEGVRPPPTLCGHKRGEIVICANPGRSPDRIPLPDERGPARHPGEFARADAGPGPVPVVPGIVVATFGMSRAVKMRNATLKLIYAQEAAKQAAADKAKAAAELASATGPAASPQ